MNRRLVSGESGGFQWDRWDFYGVVFLFSLVLVLIPTWSRLPLFLDCYYHLSVMRGFADAGGWVGEAFWEFAPVGRPHVYPPLFHLLELALFRLGMSPIDIARLSDLLIFPAFLLLTWGPIRRLYGRRIAFFTLALLSSSYPLFISVTNNIPFALAFVFSLWAYDLFKRGRFLSSAIALTCAFYTHAAMSFLGAAVFLGAIFNSPSGKRREGLKVLAASFFVALPLLIHQAAHAPFLYFFRSKESFHADIHVILILMAVIGFSLFAKDKTRDRYFVVLLSAMFFLLPTNRNRFFSGIGLVPFSFFTAFLLDRLWGAFDGRAPRAICLIFWPVFCAVFFFFTPLLRVSGEGKGPRVSVDSSFLYLTGAREPDLAKAKTIYYPEHYARMVEFLRHNSSGEDILYSNLPYAGGMISVLTHRATSFAMLREVKPYATFDPLAAARYVVWFKDPREFSDPSFKRALPGRGLRQVVSTEVAYLFENPSANARRLWVKAAVPESICFGLMALAGCLILAEFLWMRKNEKKVDITATM